MPARSRSTRDAFAPWTLAVLCALVLPASVAGQPPPAAEKPASGTSSGSAAPVDVAAGKHAEPEPPQQPPTPPTPTAPDGAPTGRLARWFELQRATLGLRYRSVETSAGDRLVSQVQDAVSLRARVKFDRCGRYALVGALATGATFTTAWNPTGLGTGDFVSNVYLRHLYVQAVPVKGLEVGVGSLPFARGETTEITSYDNDGYVTGERLVVRRPADLHLDEIVATFGYAGDVTTPGFFNRHERLGEWNYRQVQATKKIGTWVAATGDFTRHAGVSFVRAAVALETPWLRAVDSVRWEQYHRFGDAPGDGFAVSVTRALHERVLVGGGLASIDERFTPLNADRFGRGTRLFTVGTVRLIRDLRMQVFLGHAVRTDYVIANRTRFDLVLEYDAVPALNKALFGK